MTYCGKGFQDEITFIDADGRTAVGISLWDQKENADTYSRAAYPELLKALGKVVEGTPEVHTYQDHTSSPLNNGERHSEPEWLAPRVSCRNAIIQSTYGRPAN